ncbi:uncharacterized protein [Amphiura filiformis]|uniref:uncharacterized protein n=1 Tax=Amphiura filiformis TaxID=82378 RepID=UPI003B220993
MAFYVSDNEPLYDNFDDYDDYRHDFRYYDAYDYGLSSNLYRLHAYKKDIETSDSESSADESDQVEVNDVCKEVTRSLFNTDYSGIGELRSEKILCDVVIKVGSQEFQAHKNILAASSGYFNTMFTSGFQESGAAEVMVEGESNIFKVLLYYIYVGQMKPWHLIEENASDVLNMACYLDLAPHALQECKRLIACMFNDKSISMQEAFKISMRPEPELCDITQAANGYIKQNFIDLAEKPAFVDETSHECLDIFLDNIKKHKSDKQIFHAITEWLMYDWGARKQHACDMLKKLHLNEVSTDDMECLLEEDMSDVTECKELLEEAIKNLASKDSDTEFDENTVVVKRKRRKKMTKSENYSQLISKLRALSSTKTAFQQHSGSGLKTFRSENTFCDVTIKVGSKSFPAHKNILAASSGYFKTMFTSGFQEAEISLDGDGEIFKMILDCIYAGDTSDWTSDNIIEVLNMAIHLKADSVVTCCSHFLHNELGKHLGKHTVYRSGLRNQLCAPGSKNISLQQA